QDGSRVDPTARDEIEVYLHRVAPPSLELLDAEGVGADDRDLLEVERRPLEAPWRLHPGDDDRAARRGDAEAGLDRARRTDRVVDDVDTAAVEPGKAVPRAHDLRPGLGADALDQRPHGLVRQHERHAESLRERPLVREARDGEDARPGMERAQDREREEPERPAAVDERGRPRPGRTLEDAVQRDRERV